jgi:hypothetical protein
MHNFINLSHNQYILPTIIAFLNSINIKVIEQKLPKDTFLPGLSLMGSEILMDLEQLKYPGDLLHEAGHIATTEEKMRPLIGTAQMEATWPSAGDEIATIIWSFAAANHLELDLEIVFHPNGYKNDAEWLIEQFSNQTYMGLPLLEWMELCSADEFPKMKKWLR